MHKHSDHISFEMDSQQPLSLYYNSVAIILILKIKLQCNMQSECLWETDIRIREQLALVIDQHNENPLVLCIEVVYAIFGWKHFRQNRRDEAKEDENSILHRHKSIVIANELPEASLEGS